MDVVRWVKRNPVGALIGAAVIVGGGYLLLKPAAASTSPAKGGGGGGGGGGVVPPPPPPQPIDITNATTQILPGHRYQVSTADPTGAGISLTAGKMQTGFDIIFGKGALVVQSVSDVNQVLVFVFDYTGGMPITVGAKDFRIPTASILDMGPTPA